MIEKNVSSSGQRATEELLHETSLLVVPETAYRECFGSQYSSVDNDLLDRCGSEFFEALDRMSCTLRLREGDLVLYRAKLWHRSQDSYNDRASLNLDLEPRI